MEPVAGLHITFLFRNAKRSYQDRIKPWNIGIDQSSGFCKRLSYESVRRPRTPKTHHRRGAIRLSNCPSPGITLRCNHSTSHLWIEDREGLLFFRDLGGRFRAFLGSRHIFRARAKHRFLRLNFIICSVSWAGRVFVNNFLVSKRQALILR